LTRTRYAEKANRTNLRVCDLQDFDAVFARRFRKVVENARRQFPVLQVDEEKEIERYKVSIVC
jgi:adenylosuccinate synthase